MKNTADNLIAHFSADRCLGFAQGIWENDRKITCSAFGKTGAYVEKVMREMGLSRVESLKTAADGRTHYAEWMLPRAWEVRSARLSFENGGIIADYEKIPMSVSMYSAKTEKGGSVHELTDMDGRKAGEWMKDKLLLTSRPAKERAKEAYQFGAAGIVTDFFPLYKGIRDSKKDMAGAVRWDGDFMTPVNDTSLFAFNLTPENGDMLREKLSKGERVFLRAEVDAESFDGEQLTVSGAIEGTDPSLGEVLLYAHLYEPRANDNASGCSVLLEIMSIFSEMIRKGEMEKPVRTVRIVLGPECAGSSAYMQAHPERRADICIVADMVGTEKVDNATFGIWHAPYAGWSFLDDLIEDIALDAQKHGAFPINSRPFGIATDNMMGDPSYKMPTVALITEPAKSYHSSMDTPDRLEPEVMKRNAYILLKAVHTLAFACENPFEDGKFAYTEKMKKSARTDFEKSFWEKMLIENKKTAGVFFKDGESAVSSVSLPDTPVSRKCPYYPVRLKKGCLCFPREDKDTGAVFDFNWNTPLNRPLFWANGQRNLWEIACLTAMEAGKTDYEQAYEEIKNLFFLLEKTGDVRIEERNGA